MTWCRWKTGSSTRRLTHFLSSTWATSPCPAASRLSGRQTDFLHHSTRRAPSVCPPTCSPTWKPTHQHWTNLHSTLQTLYCFWTADINQRRRRESLLHTQTTAERRGLGNTIESPSLLLRFTLWLSLSSLLKSEGRRVCCLASRLAWIDSLLWRTEPQTGGLI